MQAANHHCVVPQQPGTSSPSVTAQPMWIQWVHCQLEDKVCPRRIVFPAKNLEETSGQGPWGQVLLEDCVGGARIQRQDTVLDGKDARWWSHKSRNCERLHASHPQSSILLNYYSKINVLKCSTDNFVYYCNLWIQSTKSIYRAFTFQTMHWRSICRMSRFLQVSIVILSANHDESYVSSKGHVCVCVCMHT